MSQYVGIYVNDALVLAYRDREEQEAVNVFTSDELRHLKGKVSRGQIHLERHLPARKKGSSDNQLPRAPVLAREAVFLLLRRPEDLVAEDQEMLALLRSLHSEVDQAYELVQQFAKMLGLRKYGKARSVNCRAL